MSVFNIDEFNYGTNLIIHVGEPSAENPLLITATANGKSGILFPVFISNDFVLNHTSENILDIWKKAELSQTETYNMAAKRAVWDIHEYTSYTISVVLCKDNEVGTTLYFFVPDDQKEFVETYKDEYISYIKNMLSASIFIENDGSRKLIGAQIPKKMSDEMAYALYAAWLSDCHNIKLTSYEYSYSGEIVLFGDSFLVKHPRGSSVYLNDNLIYEKAFVNDHIFY